MKSAKCPDCGTTTIFERETVMQGGALLCKRCGRDLSKDVRPKVVRCNYSGLLCAYSCGKAFSPRHDYGDQPCLRNTPPSREWLDAHPTAVRLARERHEKSS